ncbi:hypothetical protein HAX54_027771, partial [Datura stramonium]|nr:hypothetical protein [Datura stramonium]
DADSGRDIDTLKEMPNFSKKLKELLTKRRDDKYEVIPITQSVSEIISGNRVEKIGDPGVFTIPCIIGHYD